MEYRYQQIDFSELHSEFPTLSQTQMDWLQEAQKFAEAQMGKNDFHGLGHVKRVINNIVSLMKLERGGDPFILLFSAWLHDIGRETKNHALKSAILTRKFVIERKLGLHEETLEKIIECIESHSFSSGRTQNSLEAKILSDADKLDALGSVGIYRASCYQHERGTGLAALKNHFDEKLLILDQKMHTETGRKLAVERISFMTKFIKSLLGELK
jgi:uncharacterized protein